MNIISSDYEMLWHSVWPQYECRSLWPIFHGPVILLYIWKTIWHMNIILPDYEMVWPDNSPQYECMSLWPIFHGPVILPYIWKPIWHINIISPDYEMVWHNDSPQYSMTYIMVQWFLPSWSSDFVLYLYKLKGGLPYNTDLFSYWQGTIQANYAVMRQLLFIVPISYLVFISVFQMMKVLLWHETMETKVFHYYYTLPHWSFLVKTLQVPCL